jgi:ribosomal protein L37AE/L43A
MLNPQNAWTVIAKDPGEISWGSHDGYLDRPEEYYTYDTNVGNSRNVSVGDLIFVKGNDYVIGFAQIESIHSRPGTKELKRCPKCSGNPEARKVRTPKWRCTKCSYEFEESELVIEEVDVIKSTASYANTWIDANLPMTRQDAFRFQATNDRQSAIRLIEPLRIPELILKLQGSSESLDQLVAEVPDLIIGGTSISVVKRRRGQHEFRLALINKFGESCFILGDQPACVLEAAHISPFSVHESHSLTGGLLLRRDLHTLFDRHLLRINPESWTVETAPQIQKYENYQALHLKKLHPISNTSPDKNLIAAHFASSEKMFAA